MSTVRSTRAKVRIITPELPWQPSATYEIDAEDGHGLLSVQVQQALGVAASGFSLVFAPGEPWGERIPHHSYVEIEMAADAADEEDPTVMVGLTNPPAESMNYAGGPPVGQTVISGVGLDSVLSWISVYHAPFVELHPETDQELERMAQGPIDERVRGLTAWLADLLGAQVDPREALVRLIAHTLLNTERAIVNLQLPSPYRLRDRLWLGNIPGDELADLTLAKGERAPIPGDWSLIEDGLILFAANVHPTAGSVAQLAHQLLDLAFHEWFARYEQGRCHIYHRVKPFLQADPVGSAGAVVDGGSLFQADALRLSTLQMPGDHVLSYQLRRGSPPFYNVFYVLPARGAVFDGSAVKTSVPPVFCGKIRDPAYVGRYGLREMEIISPYMILDHEPTGDSQTNNIDMMALARRLAEVLRAWHNPLPLLQVGSLSVLGSPRYRPGHRLVWLGSDSQGNPLGIPDREFYLEAVAHHYDCASGAYVCTLQVSRGNVLRAGVAPEPWPMPGGELA